MNILICQAMFYGGAREGKAKKKKTSEGRNLSKNVHLSLQMTYVG
jgi:hypothetical protein